MNPLGPLPSTPSSPQAPLGDLRKDAIFLSGHKFPGGPGTPGVLVVKKRLLGVYVCEGSGREKWGGRDATKKKGEN